MGIDPDKELFDSNNDGSGPQPPTSAPPPPPEPEDDDEPRKRTMSEEIEGGSDGQQTLHLSVADPQQIGEGRNAHTFYRIDVRQGQYSDPLASVRRRYSDFQWLFQRLHAEKPGSIVPIIPHQQAVQISKRMSEDLIEERRVHLEKFLRKIQVHPELEGAAALSAFFSPDAEVFEKAKKENPGNANSDDLLDGTVPSTNKEKAKHMLVKLGVRAKVARGGELEESQDGAQMFEVESYLNTLENHVKTLSKTTLSLVNVSKETSSALHELGQSLFGLHQTFDPEASKSTKSPLPSIKVISNVCASLSAINRVKFDENNDKVGTPMHELEWSIKAARLALKRRKERQLTYNTFLQQVKNREESLEKLKVKATLSPQPNFDSKMSDAQTALEQARASTKSTLDELDSVTQRFFREMDRFKKSVDIELRKLYVAHAKIQCDYSAQLDAEWDKLLPNANGGASRSPAMSKKSSDGSSDKAEMMMI